jgi:hypothetical protein
VGTEFGLWISRTHQPEQKEAARSTGLAASFYVHPVKREEKALSKFSNEDRKVTESPVLVTQAIVLDEPANEVQVTALFDYLAILNLLSRVISHVNELLGLGL